MIGDGAPSIFRRVEAISEAGSHRIVTPGRLLLLLETYLLVATQVAIQSETFIAPPMVIFTLLHHWMWLSIPVAFICACEFFWRRRWRTALVLFLSIIVAGVGNALLIAG
ncbi:MAG TPA: hypothetical protein VN380_08520 [Thermoanaerobaculia bacterium]|jgi:hypothetical protein|nr:hypothetical protein [Thermoanaerobaculia bacterium]